VDAQANSRAHLQAKEAMKKLVILDFDGTIYNGDSMRDFARYLNPAIYLFSIVVIVFPALINALGIGSRDGLKRIFLRINFGRQTKEVMQEKGRAFFELNKKKCFKKAVDWIAENKAEMHIIIVSGSCHEWLQPFADDFGLELLCTELAYDDHGNCSGEWVDGNITGKDKVRVVKNAVEIQSYDEIIAFGDQKSDALLSEIASEFHMNYFRS
jgi:HAD superfamily phosphoserine phosphatase-like hydrolase